MASEVERSAVLRRPQSGTPDTPNEVRMARTELVGDAALIDLSVEHDANSFLCGLLLKAQLRTYKRTGHIISYADEYVMRKIRTHARRGTVPAIYCRCMRCSCVALLYDWVVACDLADNPLMVTRRFPAGSRQPVSREFYQECKGNERMRDGLILLD